MNPHHLLATLADARQLFREKAYPEALDLCDMLLRKSGPHADVFTLKALIYQQSGKLVEAGKAMDLALHEDPGHPGMLFTAALINRKLKNFDLAKKQAMKAARADPDNPQIICQCAMIVGSIGEPKYALHIVEKFTQKHHDNAEAWHLIGKYQQALGNKEAAKYALQKCLALQADHAGATKLLEQC